MVMGGLGLLTIQSFHFNSNKLTRGNTWSKGSLRESCFSFCSGLIRPAMSSLIWEVLAAVWCLAPPVVGPTEKAVGHPGQRFCGVLLTALITLTWTLALRHPPPH